jgi:hypothetical protein
LSKKKKPDHKGDQPCDFQQGLASMFPQFQFPVLGKGKDDFGLVSDEDTMWEKDDREKQGHQVRGSDGAGQDEAGAERCMC